MRAPPLAINDLEPPDCFSYALNSVNLTIPQRSVRDSRAVPGASGSWAIIVVMKDFEKIEKGLLKTGFPLEFQVGRAFQRHGWSTINSKYYVDDVQGIGREIDVVAYKVAILQDVQVCTAILISCKRSDHDAWAFIAQDKNVKDPNTDWYPLHAWTNQKVLRYFLEETKWKPKYIDEARSHAFFKNVMYPGEDIFAFQLLNKDSGKSHGSSKIFDSVSSLMKAQGYEIDSRERAENLPSERIMNFNLLSVAHSDMLLCKLAESKNGEVDVSISETDGQTYIASYIINQQEAVARVNFVKFNALEPVISWMDEMHEFNVHHFKDRIDEYYQNPFKSEACSAVFKKEFANRVLVWVGAALPKNEKKLTAADFSFWPRSEGEELRIGLGVLDDEFIEALNADQRMRELVRKALAKIYRYTGPFKFEMDIPF